MNIPDDRKKKLALFSLAGGLFLIIILILLLGFRGGKAPEQEKLENAFSDLPEGENTELADSKLEEYNKSRNRGRRVIDDYWDNIGDEPKEEDGDDPLNELNNGTKASGGGSGSFKELSYSDVFGDASKPASGKTQAQELAERDRKIEERRKKTMDDFMSANYGTSQQQQPEPEKTPEEFVIDRIELEQAAVRRSDAISSIDDGYGSSGVVSLGDESQFVRNAENYPFKCMFVRDEKIKNGDRVTVRLLEDMVIGSELIPKNTHLMANCTLGSRLQMVIPSIQINGRLITLNYSAYDAHDGTKGIFCPEIDDSGKKAVANYTTATASARARTLVGGVAQDALQAGTILLSGAGQERRVEVPAGYQFFIVRSKQ